MGADGQARGGDALRLGLLVADALVAVAVHDAPDDIGFAGIQGFQLIRRISIQDKKVRPARGDLKALWTKCAASPVQQALR